LSASDSEGRDNGDGDDGSQRRNSLEAKEVEKDTVDNGHGKSKAADDGGEVSIHKTCL